MRHHWHRMAFILLASVIALAACYDDSCGCSPVIPTGTVRVEVRDQDGHAVTAATGELDLGFGRLPPSSKAEGVMFFSTIYEGTYPVHITLPSSHQPMVDQENPVSVTVAANDTTHVLFRTVRISQ